MNGKSIDVYFQHVVQEETTVFFNLLFKVLSENDVLSSKVHFDIFSHVE